jgi:hypothetical protein
MKEGIRMEGDEASIREENKKAVKCWGPNVPVIA